jgi:hypothetical protein
MLALRFIPSAAPLWSLSPDGGHGPGPARDGSIASDLTATLRSCTFAQTNTKVAVEFVQNLSGVKSPLDFIELWTHHSRKQFDILTEQTKELAAMVQKVTLATGGHLKTGATKAFVQAT